MGQLGDANLAFSTYLVSIAESAVGRIMNRKRNELAEEFSEAIRVVGLARHFLSAELFSPFLLVPESAANSYAG